MRSSNSTGTVSSTEEPLNLNKESLITNIAWTFICGSSPIAVLFSCTGALPLGVLAIPFIGAIGVVILLNRFGYVEMAKFWLLLSINSPIFIYSALLGRQVNVQSAFFATSIVANVIFDGKNRFKMGVGVAISWVCFLSLEILNYDFGIHFTLEPLVERLVYFTITAVTFLVLFLTAQFYISEERRFRQNLLIANSRVQREQTAKIAAFATLTQGIAHEIRNPVAMARSGAEIFADESIDLATKTKFAQCIVENLDRTLDIVSTMLRFGQVSVAKREPLSIDDVIRDVMALSTPHFVRHQISVTITETGGLWVLADRNALQHIFTNLFVNAVEALCEIPEPRHLAIRVTRDANDVDIAVADNGPGIPEWVQSQLFDSFFTTKHGNLGLGMAVVLKLVSELGGTVRIVSDPNYGPGTTIGFRLPVAVSTAV